MNIVFLARWGSRILVRMMVFSLQLKIGNLDVELIGGYGCIVLSCLIVDYLQYLLW